MQAEFRNEWRKRHARASVPHRGATQRPRPVYDQMAGSPPPGRQTNLIDPGPVTSHASYHL